MTDFWLLYTRICCNPNNPTANQLQFLPTLFFQKYSFPFQTFLSQPLSHRPFQPPEPHCPPDTARPCSRERSFKLRPSSKSTSCTRETKHTTGKQSEECVAFTAVWKKQNDKALTFFKDVISPVILRLSPKSFATSLHFAAIPNSHLLTTCITARSHFGLGALGLRPLRLGDLIQNLHLSYGTGKDYSWPMYLLKYENNLASRLFKTSLFFLQWRPKTRKPPHDWAGGLCWQGAP